MENFIEILSIKRHDLLNHIQVISGYLQLNKIDRAKQYLVDMVEELTRECQLFSGQSGQVALALLYLQHRALLYGVRISVKLKASLKKSRVPEEILTAIIRVYGLTLQEVQHTAKQVYEENCLLDIFEQTEYLEWRFGIPSGQHLSQRFIDRVGLILNQEGVEQVCVLRAFTGGVCLKITKAKHCE